MTFPQQFAFWYQPGNPTTPIGNPGFVVGRPIANFPNVPYQTYYQSWDWAPKGEPSPLIDFAPLTVSDQNSNQRVCCCNSDYFRTMVLQRVAALMQAGAKGIFVDNGYQDARIVNMVCDSKSHIHHSDDVTAGQAFIILLRDVAQLVHEHGGIVILNNDCPSTILGWNTSREVDAFLDEGLWFNVPYTAMTPARWARDFERAQDDTEFTVPRLVLSYPTNQSEANLAWASSALLNLPTAFNTGDNGGLGKHGLFPMPPLGKCIGTLQSVNGIYTREYENGQVSVNSLTLECSAPS